MIRLLQAAAYFLCAVLILRDPYGLEGSEFSGGWLTGRLMDSQMVGLLVMGAAVILAFVSTRIAALAALVASLLCWPLYLYFVVPGVFRFAFRGEYSVPMAHRFVADKWALQSILALLVVDFLSIYILWALRMPTPPKETG
jgi:hypothetical protein